MALAKYYEDIQHSIDEAKKNIHKTVKEEMPNEKITDPLSSQYKHAIALEKHILAIEQQFKRLLKTANDPSLVISRELEKLKEENAKFKSLDSDKLYTQEDFDNLNSAYTSKLNGGNFLHQKEIQAQRTKFITKMKLKDKQIKNIEEKTRKIIKQAHSKTNKERRARERLQTKLENLGVPKVVVPPRKKKARKEFYK